MSAEMEKPEGPACILSIASAVPPFFVEQKSYPDYFFDVSGANDKVDLKNKFKRMCDGSSINKRHFCLTKEGWEQNPSFRSLTEAKLADKMALTKKDLPELAKNAAEKAIRQWGQDRSKITHVIFATQSMFSMPGPDYYLTKMLGLSNNVKRIMFYIHACFSSQSAMRMAKDVAENNKGARVLVVACEDTTLWVHPPDEHMPHLLVQEAIFGDGAAAVIVGADPTPEEKTLFEIHWAGENVLAGTEEAVEVRLREIGITGIVGRILPALIGEHIEEFVNKALDTCEDQPAPEYNDLFWAIHCAGRPVLQKVKDTLDLADERMKASSEILGECGNLGGPSCLFVLENVVRRSEEGKHSTTGEGSKWGICVAMGPGVTFAALLLKSQAL